MKKTILGALVALLMAVLMPMSAGAQVSMKNATGSNEGAIRFLENNLGLVGLNPPAQPGRMSLICGDVVYEGKNRYHPPPAFQNHCWDGLKDNRRFVLVASQTGQIFNDLLRFPDGKPAPQAVAHAAFVIMQWLGDKQASRNDSSIRLDRCESLQAGQLGNTYICELTAEALTTAKKHFVAVREFPVLGTDQVRIVTYTTATVYAHVSKEEFLNEFWPIIAQAHLLPRPLAQVVGVRLATRQP